MVVHPTMGVTHIFSPTIMLQSMDSSNIFVALLIEPEAIG